MKTNEFTVNKNEKDIYLKFLKKKSSETNEKRNEEFFSFITRILTLSTTLLGLTVAFHKFGQTHNDFFLKLTIFLFGLCILLSLAILRVKYTNLDKLRLELERTKQNLDEKNQMSKNIYAPFGKSFDVLTKTLYVFFSLSVLSLCIYSIFFVNTEKEYKKEMEHPNKSITLKQIENDSLNKTIKHK